MGEKMTSKENEELKKLRDKLCTNKSVYCKKCFKNKTTLSHQNPPNVFRVFERTCYPNFFFIFDKPHNNDSLSPKREKVKDYIPIDIFDQRKIEDELPVKLKSKAFEKNCTMHNFLDLIKRKLIVVDIDENMKSKDFHITNVVKCDKCSQTIKNKKNKITPQQVKYCIEKFFLKELEYLKPDVLVLFGENPFEYLKCMMNLNDVYAGEMWYQFKAVISGKEYVAVRVPHTSGKAIRHWDKCPHEIKMLLSGKRR